MTVETANKRLYALRRPKKSNLTILQLVQVWAALLKYLTLQNLNIKGPHASFYRTVTMTMP